MFAAGAIGTSADLMYGLLVECTQYRGGDEGNKDGGGKQ